MPCREKQSYIVFIWRARKRSLQLDSYKVCKALDRFIILCREAACLDGKRLRGLIVSEGFTHDLKSRANLTIVTENIHNVHVFVIVCNLYTILCFLT